MSAVYTALSVVLFLWAFWGLYVLVMGLYRAHLARRLNRFTTVLGLPFVIAGFSVDVLANITVASIVFVEWPREWLVTDRLQRHIRTPQSAWRTRLASIICDHLLDVFDPSGDHC